MSVSHFLFFIFILKEKMKNGMWDCIVDFFLSVRTENVFHFFHFFPGLKFKMSTVFNAIIF